MVSVESRQVLTGDPRRCAVVGFPVQHSLSPAIHRAAYAHLELDWSYDAVEIERGGLPAFVAGLDRNQWRGLSVTMPHKEDAAALGTPDDMVRLSGVANTVVFDGDETTVHNTDVRGFEVALAAHGVTTVEDPVIVGNGATARSALVAVARLGATRAQVWCRVRERADHLRELGAALGVDLEVQALAEVEGHGSAHDVVLSTIPAAGAASLATTIADTAEVVFDVIYDPWPTPLAEAASARGCGVVNGLDLLAAQAVGQIELFTGSTVEMDVTLQAARRALRED